MDMMKVVWKGLWLAMKEVVGKAERMVSKKENYLVWMKDKWWEHKMESMRVEKKALKMVG